MSVVGFVSCCVFSVTNIDNAQVLEGVSTLTEGEEGLLGSRISSSKEDSYSYLAQAGLQNWDLSAKCRRFAYVLLRRRFSSLLTLYRHRSFGTDGQSRAGCTNYGKTGPQ